MTAPSVGRPTIITKTTLQKLEEAFLNGATDIEACFIAGISKSTLYDYQSKNEEFSERKDQLKEMLKYQSKLNIAEKIREGDIKLSQWYLDKSLRADSSSELKNKIEGVEINVRFDPVFADRHVLNKNETD